MRHNRLFSRASMAEFFHRIYFINFLSSGDKPVQFSSVQLTTLQLKNFGINFLERMLKSLFLLGTFFSVASSNPPQGKSPTRGGCVCASTWFADDGGRYVLLLFLSRFSSSPTFPCFLFFLACASKSRHRPGYRFMLACLHSAL